MMDDAVNFGGIGMVIGHELTHGFDDEGRQFDAQGNLHDWWTPEDAKRFEERVACIDKEYSGFTVAPGVHVNGKLTLGENTADNGGVRVSLNGPAEHRWAASRSRISTALRRSSASSFPSARSGAPTSGRKRCGCRCRPIRTRRREFRVNGVVQNMPEFQKAFSCKAGSPMVSADACHVW